MHGQRGGVLAEFVSANPTGPLHVGHGRGAAYGASVSAVLEAAGHAVSREYYVNDYSRDPHLPVSQARIAYGDVRVNVPTDEQAGDERE